MATGGKLEVQIGADKTDFDKKIKEIEFDIKELSKVKLDRLKVGLDTTEINAQIKDAKTNLNQLKSTVKDTGQSFSALTPKVANGGNALMQFSRIAQDAPYGIIGIGNNITATVESFGYLKQATGSTGGALKALGQSILGTGGILLGVSLLTTGLTYLAQSGLSVSDVIDKLSGNFDEFGNTLNKISVDAAKSSGAEVATMQALVATAKDETRTRKERLIAVQQLQDLYPAYFGNLKTEQILNGNLTIVTKELTKAIIAKAEAEAISAKIGELASQKLDLQIQKEKAILKLKEAQASVKGAVTVTGGTLGATGLSNEGKLSSATSRVKDLNVKILEVQIQQDKLASMLNQKTEDSIKLLDKKEKITKAKVVKDKTHASFDPTFIAPFVSTISGLNSVMDGFDERTRKAFENATGKVKEETDKMTAILAEFNANANDLILNSITETFSNLGVAIGEALATGGDVLSAIGQTIIQAFGNFISSMGDLLIKYGTLAILKGKLDLAIAAGGPVSIAAGIAAVAVGIALKAAGAAIGSFASSGGSRASSSSGAGANNTSFTSSGFGGNQGGGTVVFEISGQKLIGVLSNTINGNKRLGGALGIG